MVMIIRDASLKDAAEIAGLMCNLGYETSPAQMASRLEAISLHPDYISFVAIKSGRTVGFLALSFGLFYERDGSYARIVALSVAPEAQRCGIGSALVAKAEQIARERGAVSCYVNSGLHRKAAHAFYEQAGYIHKSQSFSKTFGKQGAS